jgi:DNA-binding transcriptional ArsR family regulator
MAPNLDVIGDSTRRRILALLAIEREVCVCEFVAGPRPFAAGSAPKI